MTPHRPETDQTRWLTWPNLITVLRLVLLVPVCWLLLLPMPAGQDVLPVVLLGLWASTDWIDGFLARRLDQASRLGELLDPIADRIGIAAVVVVLVLIGLLPVWAVITMIAIDLLLVILAGPAARRGDLHVSWAGKTRTALMLIAVVLLVAGNTVDRFGSAVGQIMITVGGVVFVAGIVAQVIAGIGYLRAAFSARAR